MESKSQKGALITLVVLALILAGAYVGLEFYSDGERDKAVAETRGTQVVQALSRFKLEAGKYPERLETLVPKHIQKLPSCPGGETFGYAAAAGEYTLTCPNVGFKTTPYKYDSRMRGWQG
jgi:hypothetical protein